MANTTYNMPCTTPEMACASQPALVSFFLRAHHNVVSLTTPYGLDDRKQQSRKGARRVMALNQQS